MVAKYKICYLCKKLFLRILKKVFKKYLSIYLMYTFYKSIQYLYLEYFFEKVFSIPTLNTLKSIYEGRSKNNEINSLS